VRVASLHRISSGRGSEVEQLILNLGVKPPQEPVLVLDPRLQEELIVLMAAATIAVHEAGKGTDDDRLS
jgi:hypothetical protein